MKIVQDRFSWLVRILTILSLFLQIFRALPNYYIIHAWKSHLVLSNIAMSLRVIKRSTWLFLWCYLLKISFTQLCLYERGATSGGWGEWLEREDRDNNNESYGGITIKDNRSPLELSCGVFEAFFIPDKVHGSLLLTQISPSLSTLSGNITDENSSL